MTRIDLTRWSEICAQFDELVELEPEERRERLSRIGDAELRRAVELMLAQDAVADDTLKRLESGVADCFIARSSGGGSVRHDPLNIIGTTLSHFRILETLGAGGMGVVYRAEDTQLKRDVALKFPLPHHALDAAVKERFLREARTAGALDHPSLCSVHEVGETDSGQLFLAMPLYGGETLNAKLARSAPLPLNEALQIARQIADGLACAHAAGIVHRDLKPGNVMLLPDGSVKILDFGLAKITDLQTASHAGLGTAAYMSPEQIRGGTVDQRADLWALGVVLYEMTTGKRPFSGDHDISIVQAVLHDTPTYPSMLRKDVPRVIDDIVLGLLQKNAARRYASAVEVAADIAAIQEGAVPPHRRRALPRSVAGLARPRNALIAGVFAATIAALLLVAFSTSKSAPPVLAVGHIKAVGLRANDPSANAFPEMLSNQLAYTEKLEVVSRARMQELLARTDDELSAARAARVGLLLQGELHPLGQSGYRLELRHLNVQSGKVRYVHTIRAETAIQLAREAATSVNRSLGLAPPADAFGINSVGARALYEQGLGALYNREDPRQAFTLFTAALKADSSFTMAAFYAARTAAIHSPDSLAKYMARAEMLSANGPEQERLLIKAYVSNWYTEPRALAVAETLATRFPNNPEGAIHLANARHTRGDFLGAVKQLERALILDPTLQQVPTENCPACDAYGGMIWAYIAADSIAAAVRTARRAVQLQPDRPGPWALLAIALELSGQYREAEAAREKLAALRPNDGLSAVSKVQRYLRTGEFEAADQLLAVVGQSDDAAVAVDALWWQVVSFRYQGRYNEAMGAATRYRALREAQGDRVNGLIPRAVILQETGRGALAAIAYDSINRLMPDRGRASHNARYQAWWLTHAGDAAASDGDTMRLARLADSVKAISVHSGFGRDVRLHHHLMGLVYRARGNLAAAEAEFRAALYSTTLGYTRTNLELANVLMERGRPRAAIPFLQAALRGSLDGSPLYVTRTELHETLGRAWERAGQPDSASHHYRRVLNAWRHADALLSPRRQEIKRRLAALAQE